VSEKPVVVFSNSVTVGAIGGGAVPPIHGMSEMARVRVTVRATEPSTAKEKSRVVLTRTSARAVISKTPRVAEPPVDDGREDNASVVCYVTPFLGEAPVAPFGTCPGLGPLRDEPRDECPMFIEGLAFPKNELAVGFEDLERRILSLEKQLRERVEAVQTGRARARGELASFQSGCEESTGGSRGQKSDAFQCQREGWVEQGA